jgi:hypothetical protein
MVWLSAYLLLWTVVLLYYTHSLIEQVTAETIAEVSVGWELPPAVTLKPGPAAFRYDSVQKKLIHTGAIAAERKLELRELFTLTSLETPVAAQGQQPAAMQPATVQPATEVARAAAVGALAQTEQWRRSYHEAIDNLAHIAGVRQTKLIGLVLVLGALGGALGAILRSLVDFVGHACYTKELDLGVWWPLYFTRPIVGAILGFVLVILFKGKLLSTGDVLPQDDSLWWVGLAVIGGFSTVDVTLRLRLAAKALFGVEPAKNPPPPPSGGPPQTGSPGPVGGAPAAARQPAAAPAAPAAAQQQSAAPAGPPAAQQPAAAPAAPPRSAP